MTSIDAGAIVGYENVSTCESQILIPDPASVRGGGAPAILLHTTVQAQNAGIKSARDKRRSFPEHGNRGHFSGGREL